MSDQLKAFFEAYLKWAESGEGSNVFEPSVGLCDNLDNFIAGNKTTDTPRCTVTNELSMLLRGNFSNPVYPFETKAQYHERSDLHKNPKRIAWVRKQLEK